MALSSLSAEEVIRACVETGDTASWEEFVRRFHPLIAGTVARTARRFGEVSPQLIDDLVQETYLKICSKRCRILREFKPRGTDSVFGLLKTVARSVAQDHFRHRLAGTRWPGKPELPLEAAVERAEASRGGLPPAERQTLLGQIDRYLRSGLATIERDRWIFWLYYRQGLTGREIATIPGIGLTQKGVESAIQRLTSQVRAWLVEKAMKNNRKGGPNIEDPEGKPSGTSF